MFQKNLKKSAFVAVLMALAVSGSAFAEDAPKADDSKEVKVKPGDKVDVVDGGTVIVDVSGDDKAKAAPKVKPAAVKGSAVEVKDSNSGEPAAQKAPKVMADDFATPKADDEVDTNSTVEIAVRGNLSPTGPTLGGNLGFAWRPVNRARLYVGFTAGKGLVDMKGEEKEMAQFGFSAAATRVMTPTVEFGAFGTVSWSYRDVVKEVSTSFAGIGPGFRVNKLAGILFFEAALPLGWGKKFASNPWGFGTAMQASAGFHF